MLNIDSADGLKSLSASEIKIYVKYFVHVTYKLFHTCGCFVSKSDCECYKQKSFYGTISFDHDTGLATLILGELIASLAKSNCYTCKAKWQWC